MTYLLNNFTTLIPAILAGSVFIAAIVVWMWAMIEELMRGYK